jgi:hypothetical protein
VQYVQLDYNTKMSNVKHTRQLCRRHDPYREGAKSAKEPRYFVAYFASVHVMLILFAKCPLTNRVLAGDEQRTNSPTVSNVVKQSAEAAPSAASLWEPDLLTHEAFACTPSRFNLAFSPESRIIRAVVPQS